MQDNISSETSWRSVSFPTTTEEMVDPGFIKTF